MPDPRRFSFTLPFALPSLNVSLRQHWAERSKNQKMLHMELLAAFGPRYWPRPPFEKARVTVTRISARTLDLDNLVASVKGLVDLFKPRSDRNPMGVGLMVDDRPDRCELISRQEIGNLPQTMVVIEEMDYVPPPVKPARKPLGKRRYGPRAATARDRRVAAIRNRPP